MGGLFNWFWTVTGSNNTSGLYYGFWSGFGSDIGEVVIIAGIATMYKRHNCIVKGCWRLSSHKHPVNLTPYLTCHKHDTKEWHDSLLKQYKIDYPKQYEHRS